MRYYPHNHSFPQDWNLRKLFFQYRFCISARPTLEMPDHTLNIESISNSPIIEAVIGRFEMRMSDGGSIGERPNSGLHRV
jgi:hypothetical protein